MKKFLLLAASSLLCVSVLAQSAAVAPATAGGTKTGANDSLFASTKQMTVQRLEARIKALQDGLACANNAQDNAALNICKKQEQAALRQGGFTPAAKPATAQK